MATQTKVSLSPAIVRKLMPAGFMRILRDEHFKATDRLFSGAMISYVVKNGRVNHPVWPLAVKLAKKELARLKKEQAVANEWLQGLGTAE